MREAIAKLESGTGLGDAACEQTIKEVTALHYARSVETLEVVEKSYTAMMVGKREAMLSDPAKLDELYHLKTGDANGLKDDSDRSDFVEAFLSRLEWLFNSGTYFRFRVVCRSRRLHSISRQHRPHR